MRGAKEEKSGMEEKLESPGGILETREDYRKGEVPYLVKTAQIPGWLLNSKCIGEIPGSPAKQKQK